jgi:hypothetical protein
MSLPARKNPAPLRPWAMRPNRDAECAYFRTKAEAMTEAKARGYLLDQDDYHTVLFKPIAGGTPVLFKTR